MGLKLSHGDIIRFKEQAEKLKARAKTALAQADVVVDTIVRTTEISAAAFAFGAIQGKWGGVSLVGVPVDLLSGVALHIAAFAGVGGRMQEHLHSFGDGALASYMAGLGRQVGRSIQTPEDRARIAKSGTSGLLDEGASGGASLADEELARMVRGGR